MKEPAYLVRFDDVCPTMDWETWNKIEKVLGTSGINILRRVFGIILLAIAIKLFKAGLS